MFSRVPSDPFKMALTEIELTVRAVVCLEAAGIFTIGDLVSHSAKQLLSIYGFNDAVMTEVREKLAANGLRLHGE